MFFIEKFRFCKAQNQRGAVKAWLSLFNPSKFFDILIIDRTTRGSCFTGDGNPNASTSITSGQSDPRPKKAFGLYRSLEKLSNTRCRALAYIPPPEGRGFSPT